MKILFVSEYFYPHVRGGGEINLHIVARTLAKQGVDVHVATSYFNTAPPYEVVEGIKIHRILESGKSPEKLVSNIKRRNFPKSVEERIPEIQSQYKFDAVHFIGSSIIAAESLQSLKVPLVATIESYPSLCPKGDRMYNGETPCTTVCSWKKFISCQSLSQDIGKMKNSWYIKNNPIALRKIYDRYLESRDALQFCHIVSISKYVQSILQIHNIRSKVIPNSFEHMKMLPENPQGKMKILYLGSLTNFKGPMVLLEAVKDLENIRCDFYGDGALKEDMVNFISRHEIDGGVHSSIPHKDIPNVYANADIVVFPSKWPEPFGRISIEAQYFKKPIVGSDVGGINETIQPEAGILVQPGNAKELQSALLDMIKNIDKYKEYANRNNIFEKYSAEKNARVLINYYKSIID